MGLKGCKWSSLNAQSTEIPLSHPVLELENVPILALLALWGNKNWRPSIKMKQIEIFQNKMASKFCKSQVLQIL